MIGMMSAFLIKRVKKPIFWIENWQVKGKYMYTEKV